jgi:hypothetical protein
MANLKNLQGRKFDPVRFAAAVQRIRREFAARTGEPVPEAPDDLPELPELQEDGEDGVTGGLAPFSGQRQTNRGVDR